MEGQLRALSLEEEFTASIQDIRQTIRARNAVVHAVIQIGFSGFGWYDRESVISILYDNDETKRQDKADTWEAHACEDTEHCPHDIEDFLDFSWEIDEPRLELQLNGAYDALEKCVDIWMRVDEILPQPESFDHH